MPSKKLVFETERLIFRPFKSDDLDDLFSLYREPELMQYITGKPRTFAKTRERLQKHMAEYKKFGFGLFAAVLKENGEMVGRCGLEAVEKGAVLEGELAWMYKKEHWGKGFASEFGAAMIEQGFQHFPIKRMFARAYHKNAASIRVMQKLGMQYCGLEKEEGEDIVIYEIYPTNASG